jgi:hypothetical protein
MTHQKNVSDLLAQMHDKVVVAGNLDRLLGERNEEIRSLKRALTEKEAELRWLKEYVATCLGPKRET